MGGKVSAEYYRKWRASHPDYRARQVELKREYRKTHGREDRSKEYRNRRTERLRRNADNGWPAESLLVRRAQELATAVKRPDRRTLYWDDTHEELVNICVLALCEGSDPHEAMRQHLKREWQHRYQRIGSINEALI